MIGKRVAILGGGVAGLTAAHELSERGFAVHLFERQPIVGGKARTIGVTGSGTQGRRDLPGEHGFRFFPGFYQHLMDTMRRIPYGANPRGVLDNLVDTTRIGVTRPGTRTMVNAVRCPRTLAEVRTIARVLWDNDFALNLKDVGYGLGALLRVATTCPERRRAELDAIPWHELTRAQDGSEGYKQLIASTLPFVALRAQSISSSTTGSIALQMAQSLLKPGTCSDRVLSGPTSDVWIEPWHDHLRRLGVTFHLDAEVRALHSQHGRLHGVTIRSSSGPDQQVTADWFVAALPVEVMAQLVSAELLCADPQLAQLHTLRHHTQWMVGMQFFLRRAPALVHGHYIHMQSPWALTSVMHQQFWPDGYLQGFGDSETQAILSIDISDWNTPGRCGKTARDCTRQELIDEVWTQLCESINGPNGAVLRDDDIQSAFVCPSLQPATEDAPARYDEPLFVNSAGSFALRPATNTGISNLFLAGDYVRTDIELACMEGANESARRAVNALLERSGAQVAACSIWPLREPAAFLPLQTLDRLAFQRSKPWLFDALPRPRPLANLLSR